MAQITDLDIVGEDPLCQGRVATHAQVQEAVEHINSLDPGPDVRLASGSHRPWHRRGVCRVTRDPQGLAPARVLVSGGSRRPRAQALPLPR